MAKSSASQLWSRKPLKYTAPPLDDLREGPSAQFTSLSTSTSLSVPNSESPSTNTSLWVPE
eukprot:12544100-Heterocapsa_arctica.AAC.1